jgi:hypothetical protein
MEEMMVRATASCDAVKSIDLSTCAISLTAPSPLSSETRSERLNDLFNVFATDEFLATITRVIYEPDFPGNLKFRHSLFDDRPPDA